MACYAKKFSQYLRREEIDVTILNVLNPSSFIIKESNSLYMSAEAKEFSKMEDEMQDFYSKIDPVDIPVSRKSIVVVKHSNKYYRAEVISVVNSSKGILIRVYLLDYGKKLQIERNRIYAIEKKFEIPSYQAIEFKLSCLEPMTLVLDQVQFTCTSGPAPQWDESSERYIRNLVDGCSGAKIKVTGVLEEVSDGCEKRCIYGSLRMKFNEEFMCVNDALVQQKFAAFNPDLLESIISVKDILDVDGDISLHSTDEDRTTKPKLKSSVKTSTSVQKKPSTDQVSDQLKQLRMIDEIEQIGRSSEFSRAKSPIDEKSLMEKAEASNELKQAPVSSNIPSFNIMPNTDIVQKLLKFERREAPNKQAPTVPNSPSFSIEPNTNIAQKLLKFQRKEKPIDTSPASNPTKMNIAQKLLKLQGAKSPQKSDSLVNTHAVGRSFQESINISPMPGADHCGYESPLDVTSESESEHLNQKYIPPCADNLESSKHISQGRENVSIEPCETNQNLSTSQKQIITPDTSGQKMDITQKLLKFQSMKSPAKIEPVSDEQFHKTYSLANEGKESSCHLESLVSIKEESSSDQIRIPVEGAPVAKLVENPETKENLTNNENLEEINESSSPVTSTQFMCSDVPQGSYGATESPLQSFGKTLKEMQMKIDEQMEKNTDPLSTEERVSNRISDIYIAKDINENLTTEKMLKSCSLSEESEPNIKADSVESLQYLPAGKAPVVQLVENAQLSESKNIEKHDKSSSLVTSIHSDVLLNLSEATKSPSNFLKEAFDEIEKNNEDKKFSDVDSEDAFDYILSKKRQRKFTNNGLSDSEKNGNSSPEKLFRPYSSSEEFEPYFKTDVDKDLDDKSLWERLKVPAVCLGEDVPNPIFSTDAAPFCSKLYKTLNEVKFSGPTSIQSVVWPAMFRNRSLVAVSPPHSGKTLAYLLPLLSEFIQSGYEHIAASNGPILIILCSSWQKVREVGNHCRVFLKGSRVKIFSLCNDCGKKKHKEISLANGCDILISTPACLIEMLDSCATNFERCCHFVLDDGNSLMKELDQLTDLMKLFVKAIECRSCVSFPVQIVLCVERWTKHVVSFIKTFLLNPLMFFTSFLESAIYAHIPISTHVCVDSEKKKVLLDILENPTKTVICVADFETASEVHDFLKHEGTRAFFVHENLEHYNADAVLRSWKAMQSTFSASCLVITDASLIKMGVSDANCIIHYDVPEISRLQFGYRFSCIAEHFSKMAEGIQPDCTCHIIVSNDSKVHIPSLMKILTRTHSGVPKELNELKLKQWQEIQNSKMPLCHYFKAFGFCKTVRCEYRHDIVERLDKPLTIVCEGDIQAIVTHVFDASHFCVRILKYISPETRQTLSLSSTYARVGFILREFYGNPENQIKVESPVISRSYVLCEKNSLYHRVRILDVDFDDVSKRKKYKIFFLDDGNVNQDYYTTFYKLTKKLELSPPMAAEVYLCNTLTTDSCLNWNPKISRFISNLLNKQIVTGKIVMSLGHTLWLHPFVLREKLNNVNEHVNVIRVDHLLKSNGYARENKTHLPKLLKACDTKIPQPQMILPSNETADLKQSPEINYAFLECGIFEEVFVSYVNTPHQFYVHREKFADCLDDMVDEINKKMEKKPFANIQPLQKGMHCIAPFAGDNRFYRAAITKVSASNKTVDLFFVDFGDTDTVSDEFVYAIPPEFLLLPFQAIECELDGICAPHGGFSEKANDMLHDLTRDAAGDMKPLPLKALTKAVRYDGGYRYVVDMLLVDGKLVSDFLIEEGLVDYTERLQIPSNSQDHPSTKEKLSNFKIPEEPSGFAISDDELLSEEKDAAAFFCGIIAHIITHEEVIEKSRERREMKREMKVPAKTAQVVSITEYQEEVVNPPVLNSLEPTASAVVTDPSPKRNVFKPKIIWWDTVSEVHISIMLRNVKHYEIDVSDDKFVFSTTKKDKFYKTQEVLFSDINSEEKKIECTSSSVNIVLKKKVSEKWLRLTKEGRKFFHIKYDLNHLDFESDSEDDFLKLEPITNEQSMNGDDDAIAYISDEISSGSTDEDEKYVQPWRKAAEYRDPYNLFP